MKTACGRLTDRQFLKYCELVYCECGIKLNGEKRALLNARIAKRLRLLGVSPDRYFDLVMEDPMERACFIDAISTNHTYFFRESASFKYVGADSTAIWSAACSSGEEPYSLAAHCAAQGGAPDVLATDISENCLQTASMGIYPDRCAQNIPESVLKKCFQRGRNRWAGMMRVKPEVRRMVSFRKFNLLKDPLPDRWFDIIFCRNVMIYFDAPTKARVVARLCRVLKDGGLFIIGGAESLNGLSHPLRYIEPSVYIKP